MDHSVRRSSFAETAESGLAQFANSLVYSGIESPIRAMAQVADHFTGADTALAVESGFAAIGVEGPQPAEFGSKGWYAQQLGSAAGMVVPFLLLRGGLGRIAEEGTQSAALETVSLTRAAVGEARLSGATGMIYGSVLTPGSAANVHNSDFYKERLSSGLTDMATFGALGFSGRYLSAGFEAAAGAIERSSLPALARESLVSTLRFPLIAGAASGIPSGSINAEVNALKDGRLLATGDEFKESIAGMTFVGAAMSTAPWLLGKAQEVAGGKNEVGARPGGQKENTDTLKGQPLDEAALKDAVERALKRISLNNGMGPQEAQGPQSLLLGTLARMTARIELLRRIQQEISRPARTHNRRDRTARRGNDRIWSVDRYFEQARAARIRCHRKAPGGAGCRESDR